MKTTINQRIANLRKAKRLTQKEFSEKLNVSDKLVSKWEQEGNTPVLDDIINISEVFKLSLDYLIHGKESKSDIEALKPALPPLPPFDDPIQTLVKKINEFISKNKLQKYKEHLFPSSSEDLLYDIAERVRKATLEDWGYINWQEDQEFISGGYKCYIYRGDYKADRRNSKTPIDEKYWAQVEDSSGYIGCCGDHNHISKTDKQLLEHGFGIFRIKNFGCSRVKDISDNEFRLIDYDISFDINLNALFTLDNFEIYQRLTASEIPVYYDYSKTSKKTATNYFEGLNFNEGYYKKIANSKYGGRRDYEKYPVTYQELIGLTDLRFLSLLQKDELNMLLDKVNLKHKRVWEIITALIECGATKKKVTKRFSYSNEYWEEVNDTLGTLMLYELSKMKLQN